MAWFSLTCILQSNTNRAVLVVNLNENEKHTFRQLFSLHHLILRPAYLLRSTFSGYKHLILLFCDFAVERVALLYKLHCLFSHCYWISSYVLCLFSRSMWKYYRRGRSKCTLRKWKNSMLYVCCPFLIVSCRKWHEYYNTDYMLLLTMTEPRV